MASIIYNSCLRDEAIGNIDFDTDTFRMMLVTSTYVENADTHNRRDDITNEVTGTGYTAGGAVCTVTVSAVDTGNDRVTITLGETTWDPSTITAAGAVVYKDRGGAASADELVAYIDFGGDFSSTNGPFTVQDSTIQKNNQNA